MGKTTFDEEDVWALTGNGGEGLYKLWDESQ